MSEQRTSKELLSRCEQWFAAYMHDRENYDEATLLLAAIRNGAADEPAVDAQPWKCTICNTLNPDDVTHCRQCEYSRMVMRDGRSVPRDGRL